MENELLEAAIEKCAGEMFLGTTSKKPVGDSLRDLCQTAALEANRTLLRELREKVEGLMPDKGDVYVTGKRQMVKQVLALLDSVERGN